MNIRIKSKRYWVSARLQILFFMIIIVIAVASAYTLATLFHRNKTVDMHDMAVEMAAHIASEAGATLTDYHQRLKVLSQLLLNTQIDPQQKHDLTELILDEFSEFVAVSLHEKNHEVSTVYNAQSLEKKKLSPEALQNHRLNHPLPFSKILQSELFVESSLLINAVPLITMAIPLKRPNGIEKYVISAFICPKDLIQMVNRSKTFLGFILDNHSVLLSHPDVNTSWINNSFQSKSEKNSNDIAHAEMASKEFYQNNRSMVGAVARLGFDGYVAGVQAPKSAFITSNALLKNATIIASVIILATALLSLFWLHYFTRSMRYLSRAAQRIGQGDFNVHVKVASRDEIGELSDSFNQMANELNTRERILKETQSALVQSEKMAAFGQIGAGIAHEVQNPIAGILGLTQVCQRQTKCSEILTQNLKDIEKEAKHCKTIIDNLLRFARQEEVSTNRVAVEKILIDTLSMTTHQLQRKNINIETQWDDDLPHVQGNSVQLQQVFFNLLTNAHQAIGSGPGTIRITTARPSKDQLELRIADTGPGLPQSEQSMIFEPFYTTKEIGQGTGLGLWVSYTIIKAHKGSIDVKSTQNKGTEFIITLPVAPN